MAEVEAFVLERMCGRFGQPAGRAQMLAYMVLGSFVRALDGFEAVLAGVGPGSWDAPSP